MKRNRNLTKSSYINEDGKKNQKKKQGGKRKESGKTL